MQCVCVTKSCSPQSPAAGSVQNRSWSCVVYVFAVLHYCTLLISSMFRSHERKQYAQLQRRFLRADVMHAFACRLSSGGGLTHHVKQLMQQQRPSRKLTLPPIMQSCAARRPRATACPATGGKTSLQVPLCSSSICCIFQCCQRHRCSL